MDSAVDSSMTLITGGSEPEIQLRRSPKKQSTVDSRFRRRRSSSTSIRWLMSEEDHLDTSSEVLPCILVKVASTAERSVGDENDLSAEDVDLEDRAWGGISSEMLMKGLATHHTDLRVSSAISKYSLGPHRRYCQAERLLAVVG
jgi:hypothetical protein